MNIRISNLTKRLVVINLNSGRSVILGPGETSNDIPATETRGNRMVEQMKLERVVAEEVAELAGKAAGGPQKGKVSHKKKR